jgi:protein arginine kinase activator
MLCNICKQNEAKVHFSEIVDNELRKIDLCENCAKAKGVDDPTNFSLADLLLGLGAAQEMEKAAEGLQIKCPHCGFTQADFKKAGRLGCADCYLSFAEGLESLLKSMHKGTRHVGKVPKALRQTRDLEERVKTLQHKLDKAIASEDFEQAADLRDELKRLQHKRTNLLTS